MQDRWALGLVEGDLTKAMHPEAEVEWLHPPPGRFYADPFLARGVFFFEDYTDGKGCIALRESWEAPTEPALVAPFHLSYPCLVEHQGEVFMVPEQHQTGRVDLYRAHRFPRDWRRESTLLEDFPGVDPTLHHQDGLWWMWLGRQDDEPRSKVFLYWARELTGPWQAHPQNPVIYAPLLARCGGAVTPWQGRLLRPAQNRNRTYGGSLVLWEIETLTPEEYREREWARWEPQSAWPYPDGLHHLCCSEGFTVLDAKRKVESL